jgi:hypothetical protein
LITTDLKKYIDDRFTSGNIELKRYIDVRMTSHDAVLTELRTGFTDLNITADSINTNLTSLCNQTKSLQEMMASADTIQGWTVETYARVLMRLKDASLPAMHTNAFADRYIATSLRSMVNLFSDVTLDQSSLDDALDALARTLLKRGDALKLAEALQGTVQSQWADCPSFAIVAGDGGITIDKAHLHTAWKYVNATNAALGKMTMHLLSYIGHDTDKQLTEITDGVMGMMLLQCAADRRIIPRVQVSTSFSSAALAFPSEQLEFDIRGCMRMDNGAVVIECGEVKSTFKNSRAEIQLFERLNCLKWVSEQILIENADTRQLVGHIVLPYTPEHVLIQNDFEKRPVKKGNQVCSLVDRRIKQMTA